MKIYKLKYTDKETAIADLKTKGVYNEDLSFGNGIHAVVDVGLIALTDAIFDENLNMIAEPTFIEGYHFDIMSEFEIDFGIYCVNDLVNVPKHTFLGYEATN